MSGIVLTERVKEYPKKVGSPNVSLSVKGVVVLDSNMSGGDTIPTIENLWLDLMTEMFVFGCTRRLCRRTRWFLSKSN